MRQAERPTERRKGCYDTQDCRAEVQQRKTDYDRRRQRARPQIAQRLAMQAIHDQTVARTFSAKGKTQPGPVDGRSRTPPHKC